MPFSRYPTSVSRLSRLGRSETFNRGAEAFAGPGAAIRAATTQTDYSAGYVAENLEALGTYDPYTPGWFLPDAEAAAEAEALSGGLATPFVVAGVLTAGYYYLWPDAATTHSGWENPDFEHRYCGGSVAVAFVNGPSLGTHSGATICPPSGSICGQAISGPFSGTPPTGVSVVSGATSLGLICESWCQKLTSTGAGVWTDSGVQADLRPGHGTPLHFPNEHPELAPMLNPGFPVPRTVRETKADPAQYPEAPYPSDVPSIVPVPVVVQPFPVVLVQPTPGSPPATLPEQHLSVRGSGSDQSEVPSGPFVGEAVYVEPGFSKPPRKREKQRKINVRSKFPKTWVFLNAITEGLEFVDDLWRALPRECKTKNYIDGKRRRTNPAQKMADLYRCWPEMDVAKAVTNTVNDQLSDMFYALPGRAQSKLSQRVHKDFGLMDVTNRLGHRHGDPAVDRHLGGDLGQRDWHLPRITQDKATGKWALDYVFGQIDTGYSS